MKRFIRKHEKGDTNVPDWVPLTAEQQDAARRLRSCGKAVRSGKDELDANPRARSAIMRVATRLG